MDIEQIFYGLTTTVALSLAVLTLQRLLSGWWRKYYLLAAILVLQLAQAVPAIATYWNSGNWSLTSAQRLYWLLSLTSQATMYVFVLQLISRVGKESPSHRLLLQGLSVAAVLAAGISVLFHSDMRPNMFMTAVTRDLTFLAAVLNMVLWRFLMRLKKRDMLLLAVSAGMGIQCTGDAIGHSLRMLGRQTGMLNAMQDFGNVVMSLSAVVTLAVWHLAFSRTQYPTAGDEPRGGSRVEKPEPTAMATSNSHPI